MTTEKSEQQSLVDIKSKMADYTKDVSLDRLPEDDAIKFLGTSLVQYVIGG